MYKIFTALLVAHHLRMRSCYSVTDKKNSNEMSFLSTIDTSMNTTENIPMCDLAHALSAHTLPSYRGWKCTQSYPLEHICTDQGDTSSWTGVRCVRGDIHVITVENGNLEGSLPTSIGSLSTLTRLSLRQNKLTGTLPDTLGQLTSLAVLNLQFNCLSGSIPPALSTLPSLSFLGLSNNGLHHSIPTSLGTSGSLSYLILYDNVLTGSVPASLCKSTGLELLLLFYPAKTEYTLNSHLECYAKCLSSVPNEGYQMAYGDLKICVKSNSIFKQANDFINNLGGIPYLGYAVIGVAVMTISTLLVCFWTGMSKRRATSRARERARREQLYARENEMAVSLSQRSMERGAYAAPVPASAVLYDANGVMFAQAEAIPGAPHGSSPVYVRAESPAYTGFDHMSSGPVPTAPVSPYTQRR